MNPQIFNTFDTILWSKKQLRQKKANLIFYFELILICNALTDFVFQVCMVPNISQAEISSSEDYVKVGDQITIKCLPGLSFKDTTNSSIILFCRNDKMYSRTENGISESFPMCVKGTVTDFFFSLTEIMQFAFMRIPFFLEAILSVVNGFTS